MPIICSSFTLSVRVMVALRVCGLASVPICSSPCTMIHSVDSSRSALSAKLSLPLIVRLAKAGGLTSRITSLPLGISTLAPATGTFLSGQVARSDHFVAATADTLKSASAGTSIAGSNERYIFVMESTP
jgi:hypothetical protein